MTERLVFIDLETAGTDPKRHPIIQVAAVAVDSQGDALEAYEAKLRFDPSPAEWSDERSHNAVKVLCAPADEGAHHTLIGLLARNLLK